MFVFLLCLGIAAAARLDNTYLPPSSAKSAGGNGHVLSAPGGSGFNSQQSAFSQQQYNGAGDAVVGKPSSSYGAPSRSNRPSPAYGAPSNGRHNGGGDQASARANILRFDNENNGDGNYRFEFETENKISQQEVGQLRNVGPEGEVTVVQGSYSYLGDDGQTYTVNYIADENGFQPVGDHIAKEIQMAAAEAARSGASQGNYPASSKGQNGYRY